MNDTTVWCQNASVTEPKREVGPKHYGSTKQITSEIQNLAKTNAAKGFEGSLRGTFPKVPLIKTLFNSNFLGEHFG